ncbi:queuosine precursor transporter [bacterium]|nr:queuosine precursor transporter [bacterium]
MNEILFLLWSVVVIGAVLAAFRFGKPALYGLLAMYIVLANTFVAKQITLFGLAATGGNALYGAVFLITDLISEYWGKRQAARAVLFGFLASVGFLLASRAFLLFVPSGDDFVHPAMATLFSLTPRIVFASLAAYALSQSFDVWFFHYWKVRTEGKKLWLRNNLSTAAAQAIDSVVFSTVAFFGIFPTGVVLQIALTTYLLKLIVAALDTPFIYLSRRFKPGELKSVA